jgi:hypothetical protein
MVVDRDAERPRRVDDLAGEFDALFESLPRPIMDCRAEVFTYTPNANRVLMGELEMRIFAAALLVTSTLVAAPVWSDVRLPHKTMSYNEACPGFQKLKCAPDDDPRQLRFNVSPPVLEITSGGPAYNLFLGKVYPQPYRPGMNGRYCNVGSPSSILAPVDLDTQSASSSFEYTYQLKSNLGAGADVDLVQAATAAGLPPAAADKVRAAAKAAYKKAKDRKVRTTGVARLVRLRSDVLQEILHGTDARLEPCRALLRANPDSAMIKALTVFHIQDASSTTDIDTQIAADIKASLSATDTAKLADVNAAIDRTVHEQIKTALADRYLVWAVTWLKLDDQ